MPADAVAALGRMLRICAALGAVATAACTTTIGTPNPELLRSMAARGDFGAAQVVRVCALLDAEVTEAAARRLIDDAWNDTEAAALGLRIALAFQSGWKRDGADSETIFRNIRMTPVAAGCDRVLAFLGPAHDFVTELAGGVSFTHGFVLAAPESTQRFSLTPVEVARHELYHLIGCGHSATMDECYRRIAAAKKKRAGETAFFPVYLYVLDEDIRRNCGANPLIGDREQANAITQRWLARNEGAATGAARVERRCDG